MERLMMKNSAGFKVDLLWYATSSRMQLPMTDSIPVKQKRIELCYTLCRFVPTVNDPHNRDWRVVWTYKIRYRVNPWRCHIPWGCWRQTQQMCLKHFPSKMMLTHRVVNCGILIEKFTQTWFFSDDKKTLKMCKCVDERVFNYSSQKLRIFS